MPSATLPIRARLHPLSLHTRIYDPGSSHSTALASQVHLVRTLPPSPHANTKG